MRRDATRVTAGGEKLARRRAPAVFNYRPALISYALAATLLFTRHDLHVFHSDQYLCFCLSLSLLAARATADDDVAGESTPPPSLTLTTLQERRESALALDAGSAERKERE